MPTATKQVKGNGRRHSGRYIYDELRKQILTLKLKPGVQLDEVSLATQFELSRSPVRDALARLATEGLVTILPNRTTIVTPFEIEEFPNYISALDLVQRAVTRLAAEKRNDEDLETLRQCNKAYNSAVEAGDFQLMSELNKIFHMDVAKAAKNPYLTSYYERLLGEGQRILHLHFDYVVNSASEHKLGNDHNEMLNAIISGDANAAEKSAHDHTMLFQKRFLDYMKQNFTAKMSII